MLQLHILPRETQPIVNLSLLTIMEIKQWAKDQNLKAPSGLKKAELIQYLTGAYQEKLSGKVKGGKYIAAAIDILQPRYSNTEIDWLVHLHTHGWAVVPINGWKREFTDMFFSWFESCSINFNKKDLNSWISENMPIMLHGILKHYFGQTEMQWQIRELCAPIFAKIWGCDATDLLCSYDGGCFLPSIPKDELKNKSFKQWVHNESIVIVVNLVDS